jgi:hypothetical protein
MTKRAGTRTDQAFRSMVEARCAKAIGLFGAHGERAWAGRGGESRFVDPSCLLGPARS